MPQQLEGDGSLPGNHIRTVESMNQEQAALGRDLKGPTQTVVEGLPRTNNLAAEIGLTSLALSLAPLSVLAPTAALSIVFAAGFAWLGCFGSRQRPRPRASPCPTLTPPVAPQVRARGPG